MEKEMAADLLVLEHNLASWPTNSGNISRTRRNKIGMGVGWFSLVGAVHTYCRCIVRAPWMDDWRTTLTCLVPPSTTWTMVLVFGPRQEDTANSSSSPITSLLVMIAREATQVMGSRLSTPPHQPTPQTTASDSQASLTGPPQPSRPPWSFYARDFDLVSLDPRSMQETHAMPRPQHTQVLPEL